MHLKEVKGILSAQNGMNISRGCTHSCIYCDSRSKCYRIEHDFEDVEIKSNVCLYAIERGACEETKQVHDRYRRDERSVHPHSGKSREYQSVPSTMTTYDETLCKIIEPNVCGTRRRFETLSILRDNGIQTMVWLCPFLPYINDTEENLRGLLNYCIEAGVYGILCFGIGLTLREGNREYFYLNLDRHFPGRYLAICTILQMRRALRWNCFELHPKS